MFRKTLKKGFSLVELLVVITIIAILSVAAYSAVGGNTIKARDSRRKQDIATIQQALELYFAENSKYPTALETGTVETGKIPKRYLSEVLKDPGSKGRSYQYEVSGQTYEIAATLEGDGTYAKYETYVVGNSDDPIIKAQDSLAKKLSTDGKTLETCAGGPFLTSGRIATDHCIPYDPNN